MFAYHGIHPEEKLLGRWFEVSVEAGIERNQINNLEDTIDYESLLNITKKHFEISTGLLENVALSIESDLRALYPDIKQLNISIRKLYPPFATSIQSSEVRLEKKY